MNATTYAERKYVRVAIMFLIVILMSACTSSDVQDSTPLPENTQVLSEQTPESASDESSETASDGPAPESVEDTSSPDVESPMPTTIPLVIDTNGEIQNADRLPSEIGNLAERVDQAIKLLGDLLTGTESEERGRPTYQQVAFLVVTGDSLEGALQWRLAATLTNEGRAAYPDHGHYTFYFSIEGSEGQESVRRVFAINHDLFGDFDDSLQLRTMTLPTDGPFTEASGDLSTHLIFADTNGSQWVLSELFAQDLFVPLETGAIAAYWTIPEAELGIAQNARNGAVYALSYEQDTEPQFILEGSRWTAVHTWQIIDNALVRWNDNEWRFEQLEQIGISMGKGLQQFLSENPHAVIHIDSETGTLSITGGNNENHPLIITQLDEASGDQEEGTVDIEVQQETGPIHFQVLDNLNITLQGFTADAVAQYTWGTTSFENRAPVEGGSAEFQAYINDFIALLNNQGVTVVSISDSQVSTVLEGSAGDGQREFLQRLGENPAEITQYIAGLNYRTINTAQNPIRNLEFVWTSERITVELDSGEHVPIIPGDGVALTRVLQFGVVESNKEHTFAFFDENTGTLKIVAYTEPSFIAGVNQLSEQQKDMLAARNFLSIVDLHTLPPAQYQAILNRVGNTRGRVDGSVTPNNNPAFIQLLREHFGEQAARDGVVTREKTPFSLENFTLGTQE
jgi:hypothetical protein